MKIVGMQAISELGGQNPPPPACFRVKKMYEGGAGNVNGVQIFLHHCQCRKVVNLFWQIGKYIFSTFTLFQSGGGRLRPPENYAGFHQVLKAALRMQFLHLLLQKVWMLTENRCKREKLFNEWKFIQLAYSSFFILTTLIVCTNIENKRWLKLHFFAIKPRILNEHYSFQSLNKEKTGALHCTALFNTLRGRKTKVLPKFSSRTTHELTVSQWASSVQDMFFGLAWGKIAVTSLYCKNTAAYWGDLLYSLETT